MSKVISIAVRKGGSLKTTSALNIGFCMARMGYKILFLDLDHQADLTTSLGIKAEDTEDCNMFSSMKKNKLQIKYINDNISCVPSCEELEEAEDIFNGKLAKENIVKNLLDEVKDNYDYILIDCPPSTRFFTRNALVASDYTIIPVQTQPYAMRGLAKMIERIREVKHAINPKLEILGIFGTMFESTRNVDKSTTEVLKDFYKDLVFTTLIRKDVKLIEAGASGKDIFSYNENSSGAEDYYNLTKEILERINKK